jgi:hypothetical protein
MFWKVNIDWKNFVTVNMRVSAGYTLIDIEPYYLNDKLLWAGVFRAGSEGTYYWADLDCKSLVDLYKNNAKKGL